MEQYGLMSAQPTFKPPATHDQSHCSQLVCSGPIALTRAVVPAR